MYFSSQFDGGNGDRLIEVGSTFTKNQKFSIEELKERRRTSHKLDSFLEGQEKRPECRYSNNYKEPKSNLLRETKSHIMYVYHV